MKKEIEALIDHAANLNHEIKSLEPSLTDSKIRLVDWWESEGKVDGKKFETDEATCQFVSSDMYDSIDSLVLYGKLKKMGRKKDIWRVLKPDLTELKKIMGLDDIRSLQGTPRGTKISVTLKLKETSNQK